MPLSPLTRWLIVLSMFAFGLVFVTMNEPVSWIAAGSLGIALSLWTASVYRIVSAGANLDERAFHLTRPNGGRTAFRRISILLLAMVLFVSLMAAARAWWFHLGWMAMVVGFTIASVLLLMITTGLATGLQLSFSRTRPIKWVGWLMLALPLAVYIYKLESDRRDLWLGSRLMDSWTSNLTPAVLLTAAGYGVAWWLSASRRKWWPGLMLAALSGLCLPLEKEPRPLLGSGSSSHPMASVEFQRQPLQPSGYEWHSPDGKVGTFQPTNSVSYSGLRSNELLNGQYLLPLASELKGDNRFYLTRTGETALQLMDGWQTTEGSRFNVYKIDRFLASNLGIKLESRRDEYEPSPQRFSFPKTEKNPVFERLNGATWQFKGWLSRVEYRGCFPAFSSGTLNLDPVGRVDYHPTVSQQGETSLSLRLFMPESAYSQLAAQFPRRENYPYFEQEVKLRLLLVSRSGSLAATTGRISIKRSNSALGSVWTEMVGTISRNVTDSWPENELTGAQFHLFTERPVARVEAEIPPPGKP